MRSGMLGVIVLTVVVGMARAEGGDTGAVRDRAGMFDRTTVADANRRIDSVRQEFEIDVAIETVRDLPGQPVRASLGRQRQWLREQAQTRADTYRVDHPGFHGLYVLIVQEPRPLASVIGWPADAERDVYSSDYKRWTLRNDIERHLASPGEANKGLLRALDHYRLLLTKDRRLGPSPLGTVPALTVVGLLAGLWLVLSMLRFRLTAGERPPPLYRPGMQGSLFGLPCAFWLYDLLYREERPAEVAAAPPAEPAPTDPTEAPPGGPTA